MTASAIEPSWVTGLLGHRQVTMALACLGSLLRTSAEPLRLRLHDDGSLTESDRAQLAAELSAPTFVSREEADDTVAPLLASRPHLRTLRRENPMALKLIDIVLCAGTELAYCDTDILFFRPFAGLFGGPPVAPAVFMTDRQNAYSVRSWHLLAQHRLRLPQLVNAGIIRYATKNYDPDLLEWFFSQRQYGFAPVWVEQSAWALLGGRVACALVDPHQIAIPLSKQPISAEIVALHFVNPVRSLLAEHLAAPAATMSSHHPIPIRYLAAKPCTALDLGRDELRRVRQRLPGFRPRPTTQ